jgi:hypothetical protein
MLSLKLHNIKLSLNSPWLWTFFSPSQPILEPQICYLWKEKISLKLGVKYRQNLHLLHMIFQKFAFGCSKTMKPNKLKITMW